MAFDKDSLPPVPARGKAREHGGRIAFADSLWNHSDGNADVLLLCRAARVLCSPARQCGVQAALQRRSARQAADEPARELTAERQAAEQRKSCMQTVWC